MSKKHFIALADALRREKLRLTHDDMENDYLRGRDNQWERDVKQIADVCAASNPAFNRERWMNYVNGLCGPNGGVK
jgi:hypothetical protein